MAKTGLVLLVCALAAISCGGGGSEDASKKCDAFVTKVCTRLTECNGGQTQDQCATTLNMIFHCESAASVSSTYEACLSDLDTIACSQLIGASGTNLPPACANVVPPGS
jgi:hypothetical protein